MYPPASRGGEWNFKIPHPPRAGTHAGTMQKNDYVVRELFGELRLDCLGLEEVEAAEIGGAMRGSIPKDGGRYWTRTSDPYRVKVML